MGQNLENLTGIKTRGLQVTSPSPFGGGGGKGFVRQLSLKEMEMSEDYTCVIKHSPNPETKHIYDDCILDDYDPKLDLSQPQTGISFPFPVNVYPLLGQIMFLAFRFKEVELWGNLRGRGRS